MTRLIRPLIGTLVAGLFSLNTWAAAPDLVCQLRYGSHTQLIRQSVSADPYGAATHNLDDRFAFKAVVLGTADQIQSITLSVYDLQAELAPVMIQQTQLVPPFNTASALPALTGWSHAYSSYLGREFTYGCALQPTTP